MFRVLLAHYQGERNCIKLLLILLCALSNCFIQLDVHESVHRDTIV